MGLSTWQLALVSLTTSYPWLLLVFAVRGLGLGFLIQPLTVAALSKVARSQYTQASSLNTVVRFTCTSLGIAVLATLVQSRATTHIATLIQQSRPASRPAALLLQRLGVNLAVQDAFWLSLVVLVPAVIAILFLRTPKSIAQTEEKTATPEQAVSHVS
jgi:MFS family permease